jgi:DNA-binding transcriptional ArsR family regulator
MSRTPHHPSREQIRLPVVLDCLSDPIRLAIVCTLAKSDHAKSDHGAGELRCGDFHAFGGKSNLAYHFARLREAGLVLTRLVGTSRYMSLRRADLDVRFPGLLDAIIASAASDAAQALSSESESPAVAT